MAQTKAYPAGAIPVTLTGDVPQFRVVDVDGAVTNDGAEVIGAYQDIDALTGDTVSIYTRGVFALEASGSISKGDAVVPATGGKVSTFSGSGTKIGFALEDIADGGVGQILYRP
jgi:predicted RecA/RadA family phage recombinase